MKGLCIIAVVIAIIWAIKNAAGQRKAMNAAWAEVGRAHGLSFRRGGTFALPSMSGKVDGYLVSIDTVTRGSGKSNTTYTRYRVHYPKLGSRIRLTRQVPLLSTIGMLFGGEDHETGDAAFDDKVVVRAPDERRAIAYLTEERRRAIEKFLAAHKHASITESNATFEKVGLETRVEGLERGMRVLVELAEILQPERADGPGSQYPDGVRAAATGVATALGSVSLALPAAYDDDALEYDPAPLVDAPREPVADAPVEVAVAPLAMGSSPEPPQSESAAPEAVVSDDPEPNVPEPPRADAVADDAVIAQEPIAAPESGGADEKVSEPTEPPAPPAPAEQIGSRQQDVCAALFADDSGLSSARELFEERYADVFVTWTGKLESARHFYSDMVFGSEPGTRVEVAVARVASGILGDREVTAVLQLPAGADKELSARAGEEITFEGDLASVDPFLRQVFVRNAAIVD